MGIVSEDIASVRQGVDLVALIAEHTEVKRSGSQWMARCPMHGERTPSLSISQQKGVYYCFGCQRSGDAITFVQEIEGLDFAAAVEALAGRAGIEIRYTSKDESAARSRRRRLIEAATAAAEHYHSCLRGSDAAASATRSYLAERGYSDEIVSQWRIGWAPAGRDRLARHLSLSDAELLDSGLGTISDSGRQQDFFRSRVMFPIRDERGDTVGFGARVMPGADGPKYLNTSNRAKIYDKSKVLYGLHEHRQEIVRAASAVICEGYTDVIGCAAAGVSTAVATCGTALTEQHMALLARFSAQRLVLAFDADKAGGAAAERVYVWERQFGLQISVADLPAGSDPGDLARRDPQQLHKALADAVPMLQFRVDRSLAAADMSTIEGRARAAEQAGAVAAEHPDPLVRDPHLVRIADECRVDSGTLRGRFSTKQSHRRSDGDSRAQHSDGPEDHALRLAVHRPEETLSVLHPSMFAETPHHRAAYGALVAANGDLVAAAERLDEDSASVLRRAAASGDVDDPDDALIGVTRLTAQRAMSDLSRMVSGSNDETLRRQCADSVKWLSVQTGRLRDRHTRQQAIKDMLKWLAEYNGDEGNSQ